MGEPGGGGDDLDRCEVPKAADLLQAINLMIPDDSKLVFVLAIDRDKVASGIAMRHEKVLPLLAPAESGAGGKLAATTDGVEIKLPRPEPVSERPPHE